MRRAFTMLELVMVIVIMGIIASIGADIIASMYSNYLRSRTINRLEAQTEITLEQIAKRLQYRIKESVIARKTGSNPLAVSDTSVDSTYNILEWIGASNESFLGTPRPGWSGFIDLDSNETNKTTSTLKTSESNLTDAANTISALTEGVIDLTGGKEAALIFKGIAYNMTDFGWGNPNNIDGSATLKVGVGASIDILTINDTIPTEITEQYALSHTAYAIVPVYEAVPDPTDFNLTLRYNYQPWHNEEYIDGNSSILAEHVSLFRFKQDESILRLKLCLHDNNETGVGEMIVICKEKVVY
jgi:prepilin-type N-terminal cleavage/methylation domain-containing protein